jgi:hypothetical protein
MQECLTDKDNDLCVTSNDNDQMTLQVTYMALQCKQKRGKTNSLTLSILVLLIQFHNA